MIARRIPRVIAACRPLLARVCAANAVLLMVLSAILLRPESQPGSPDSYSTPAQEIVVVNTSRTFPPGELLNEAGALFLVGGVLLIAARLLARDGFPVLTARRLRPTCALWWLVGVGYAALFALASANAGWGGVSLSPHIQFALLGVGIASVVAGLGGGQALPGASRAAPLQVYALALITLAAFALRVWNLDGGIHAFVDELNFANGVRWFEAMPRYEILRPITGIVAFPRIYTYLEWHTTALAGHTLGGLRLASAVIGALTIPAVYLLGRALFDRVTGLIAAALLATFPPHLHYSRLAMNNIADPLFGTLALAFLARGMRSGRRLDYALAGAMLGLTQYGYEGGRVVFPAVMLAWIIGMALIGRQRPAGRGIAILALAAALVAAPVYVTLLSLDQPVLARTNSMIRPADYWRDLLFASSEQDAFRDHLEVIRATFMIYIHQPEGSYFYGGGQPFLLVYVAPCLLLGAVYALGRLRAPGPLLLALWIPAVSLGNSCMVLYTESPRYVAVFPALMLLCAVGLRAAWGLIVGKCGVGAYCNTPLQKSIGGVLLAGIVIALAVGQAAYYFGPHLERFNRDHRLVKPYPDGEDALFRSADFPPGTQIHLISREVYHQSYARDVLKFLTRTDLTVDTLSPLDLSAHYWMGLRRDVDHAFFVERGETAIPVSLGMYFQLRPPAYTPWDVPPSRQFVLYYAPALQPGEIVR